MLGKILKILFFRFAYNTIKFGLSANVSVFVLEREEIGKKMMTGISGFGFFCCPKMDISWRITLFLKMPCWTTYFLLCFLGACFFGQVVKKGNFGDPPKRKKWLITEKLFFGYFWFFSFFFSFFLFWGGCFLVLFLRVWGSGEVARTATSLDPKPSFFVFVSLLFVFFLGGGVFFFVFLEGLRVRWGGPKCHLTWP